MRSPYLVTESVHESPKERIINGPKQRTLHLGDNAVHVVQEVVHEHARERHHGVVVPGDVGIISVSEQSYPPFQLLFNFKQQGQVL